jgi:hypothetical protein
VQPSGAYSYTLAKAQGADRYGVLDAGHDIDGVKQGLAAQAATSIISAGATRDLRLRAATLMVFPRQASNTGERLCRAADASAEGKPEYTINVLFLPPPSPWLEKVQRQRRPQQNSPYVQQFTVRPGPST